jgi:NitT/TauT family transport system ATP-binding protein
MTNPQAVVGEVPQTERDSRFIMLPHARSGGISGLLEILDDRHGSEDLSALSEDLRLEIDDLLPAVDAAVMLGFAKVAQGDVTLTESGREFANAEVHRSHRIFREQLLERVPLVNIVLAMLKSKKDGQISREFVLDILDEHFSGTEALRQFETLVDWARYTQLFDYDADEERLYLAEERD